MAKRWQQCCVLLVAVLAVLAASCGGNGAEDSSSSAQDGGAGGRSEAAGAEAGDLPAGAPAAQAVSEREIVYTSDLVVRVDDVEVASTKATAVAEEAGGFLAGQDANLQGDQESSLTLRVPAAKFRAVLDAVGELGDVRQRTISSDDVTAQVVDLTGRLESQQASAERLRGLIAEADGTAAIVAIETELANRETEIEAIQGQLRVLDDQSTLATITVRYTEKAEGPKVDKDLPGFVQALKTGGVAVVTVLKVLLAVLGLVLPFAPFAVIAWLVLRWVRKRRAARPKPPPSPVRGWIPPGGAPPSDASHAGPPPGPGRYPVGAATVPTDRPAPPAPEVGGGAGSSSRSTDPDESTGTGEDTSADPQ